MTLIEGQRQKAGANRRRRRKPKNEPKAKAEPVLIVARRPDSPLLLKVSNRNIAASGRPKQRSSVFHAAPDARDAVQEVGSPQGDNGHPVDNSPALNVNPTLSVDVAAPSELPVARVEATERTRRVARVAEQSDRFVDDLELKRQRLVERLIASEGRGAISKLANELAHHNWTLPEEQVVQIQLLEHVDERRASAALDVMTQLLATQTPIKRPILDQRLRRLEEGADDPETRQKAAALRRSLRVA
jgi:hypothetical protein